MRPARNSARRAAAATRRSVAEVSSSHYVGYCFDEESTESIVKKFEELERYQRELEASQRNSIGGNYGSDKENSPSASSLPPADDDNGAASIVNSDSTSLVTTLNDAKDNHQLSRNGKSDANGADDNCMGLTQEQLEEVFRRTSSFTVRSASMMDEMDLLDDETFWLQEMQAEHAYEEDFYLDVTEEFWDDELGSGKPRNKRRRGGHSDKSLQPQQQQQQQQPQSNRAPRGNDRDSILAKYKYMQIKLQDGRGNFFTVKKIVRDVDPTQPTYIKIPPPPMPTSWAHIVTSEEDSLAQKNAPGSRYFEGPVLSFNFKSLGNKFLAILMDPPLLLPGEEASPSKLSVQDLASLPFPSIIPFGFIFIWVEKELIPDVLAVFEKFEFKYVENICWIKRNPLNCIVRQPYKYMNKSKLTMLILRKDGEVELRHQRNPDCIFDFVKPRQPDSLTEEKPAEFIYRVIETMLPSANYGPNNMTGERLLELWGKKGPARQGWTKVVELPNQK